MDAEVPTAVPAMTSVPSMISFERKTESFFLPGGEISFFEYNFPYLPKSAQSIKNACLSTVKSGNVVTFFEQNNFLLKIS